MVTFKKAIYKNGVFVDEYRYGRIADTLPQKDQNKKDVL
jgi:hypothetical protein